MSRTRSFIGLTQEVTDGIPIIVKGVPNILFVGTGDWYTEMSRQHPSKVFKSLQAAIDAVPAGDGSTTYGNYNTKIIVHGTTTVTTTVTVPATKAGIEIVGTDPQWGKAGINTATALGAGVPILKILGNNCAIRNLRVWAETTTQTGDAIHFGDATYPALYGLIENVRVQGAVSGSYLDFKNGIVIKDSKYTIIRKTEVTGGANTAVGISIEAGVGNGKRHRLENVNVHIFNDTGDAAIPLQIAADQNLGIIQGGEYITHSTADAIEIGGNEWTITGGGLAANEDIVGVETQIDWNGAQRIVGEFYVKQLGGATAASLFSEANV